MKLQNLLRIRLVIAFTVVCLLQSNAFAQEKFKPDFNRPLKVGDTYLLEAERLESESQKMSIPGSPNMDTTNIVKYNLLANVKVIAVDGVGKETKKECTVKTFSRTNGAEVTEVLPEGKMIIVTYTEAATAFEIVGKDSSQKIDLSSPEFKIYNDLITSIGGVGKVEKMGLDKPRKIGEKWNLSKTMIDEFASSMKASLSISDLKGTAQLVEKVNTGGFECLHYVVVMSTKKLNIPGISIKKGDMTFNLDVYLPLKENNPPVQTGMSVKLQISGGIPAQQGVTLDMNYQMQATNKIKF